MSRPLPQLIKSAPTLAFRHDQQSFKLMPLLLPWEGGPPFPGSECSPITDWCDQPRQRGDARQEHLALNEPTRSPIKQMAWPFIAQPGPGIEPAAQAKPPWEFIKPPVLIGFLNFSAMSMRGLCPFHVTG